MAEIKKSTENKKPQRFWAVSSPKNPYENGFTTEQIPIGSDIIFMETADATVGDHYVTVMQGEIPTIVCLSHGDATGGNGKELKFPDGSVTAVKVGGLDANTNVSGKTTSEILDMILFPEYLPYASDPSFTLGCTGADLRAVGENTPSVTDYSVSGGQPFKLVGKQGTYEATAGEGTDGEKTIDSATCMNSGAFNTVTTKEGVFKVKVTRHFANGMTKNKIFSAHEFSAVTDYAKGDYVWRTEEGEKIYYKFNQVHSRGEWNSNHADVVIIDDTKEGYAKEVYEFNRAKTSKGNLTEKYAKSQNIVTSAAANGSTVWAENTEGTRLDGNEFIKEYDKAATHTIEYVYPYFATVNSGDLSASNNKFLQKSSEKTIVLELKKGVAQTFVIPTSWQVTKIEEETAKDQWNTSSRFVKTTAVKTIGGTTASYDTYAINGEPVQATVKVRFTRK